MNPVTAYAANYLGNRGFPDVQSIINTTAQRYGLDPATMARIGQLESGLNPYASNPTSSAKGLFQFVNGTWQQYGQGNVFDPAANTDAAGRYLSDVKHHLARALGRDPTPGELYLGHQQGPGGASALLTNPDAPAAAIVGDKAVALNGGTPGMTAGQFAQMWSQKMGDSATPGVKSQTSAPASAAPADSPGASSVAQPTGAGDDIALRLALMQQSPVASMFGPPQQNTQAVAQATAEQQARRRALITGGGLASLYG